MQLRVYVRVEVAPALCGRERVEEGHLRMEGVGDPENSSSRELLPFSCGQAPFGSSPSASAWSSRSPGCLQCKVGMMQT